MSNYKSNDNSTENTSLREWWGIVRAEFSRVFEILNDDAFVAEKGYESEIDSYTGTTRGVIYRIIKGSQMTDDGPVIPIGNEEYYVFAQNWNYGNSCWQYRLGKDGIFLRTLNIMMGVPRNWSEWTEIGAVGKFTSDEGIIFNEKSKALSPNAVAMGPNCTAGGKGFQIINQGSYTEGESYTFPYMQHDGAGYATLYISPLSPFKVGMKCSITIDGITCTEAIIEEVVSESISLTLSGIPWDFPSDSGGTITIGEEKSPTIVYTLDSVDGLEVGMQYSLVNPSGESKYNAGTITEIKENSITVDSDSNDNVEGLYIAIIGHPELGTDDIGTNAFATGNSTIASSKDQSTRGRFNVEDNANKYVDIVGNGTSDEDRSNAYTLDWDGNAEFAGNVKAGKATIDSDDDLILVTKSYLKSYVDAAIKAAIGSALEGDY